MKGMDKIAAAIIIFAITVVVPWMGSLYVDNKINPIKSDVRVLREQFNFYLTVSGVKKIPEKFLITKEREHE